MRLKILLLYHGFHIGIKETIKPKVQFPSDSESDSDLDLGKSQQLQEILENIGAKNNEESDDEEVEDLSDGEDDESGSSSEDKPNPLSVLMSKSTPPKSNKSGKISSR